MVNGFRKSVALESQLRARDKRFRVLLEHELVARIGETVDFVVLGILPVD